jgi:hypothetical protein
MTDGNNCGSCGNGCPTLTNGNSYCQNGGCKTACDNGFMACAVGSFLGQPAAPYACVNLQKDPAHCGSCGNACPQSQVCDAGHCVPYILASACWECGNGNSMPLCCSLSGQTICTNASACP